MIIGRGGLPAVPPPPITAQQPPPPAIPHAPPALPKPPAVPAAAVKSPAGIVIAVLAGLITLAVLVVLFFALKLKK